jgi:hypothetical protein
MFTQEDLKAFRTEALEVFGTEDTGKQGAPSP